MNELLDIVFADLSFDKFIELLQFLVENGEVRDFDFNFKDNRFGNLSLESFKDLKRYLTHCHPTPVSLRFHKLQLGSFKIPNASVITVMYKDSKSEVTISFDSCDISNNIDKNFIIGLMEGCQFVSSKLNITKYYSGLDPAEDMDTRFFTNQEFGEYYINYVCK